MFPSKYFPRTDESWVVSCHKGERCFEKVGIVKFHRPSLNAHIGFDFGPLVEPLCQCVERGGIRPPVRKIVPDACKTEDTSDVLAFTDDAPTRFTFGQGWDDVTGKCDVFDDIAEGIACRTDVFNH